MNRPLALSIAALGFFTSALFAAPLELHKGDQIAIVGSGFADRQQHHAWVEWRGDGRVNMSAVADALGMAIVASEEHGLWAVGPSSGGRALATAVMPELTLPDRDGNPFRLGALKGTKVFLCAWASW
jgi:hypothetical protein